MSRPLKGTPEVLNLKVSIPDQMLYDWESQARQWPKVGRPGIAYERVEAYGNPIDSWVFRNRKGHVVGMLYWYVTDSPLEKAGNVNIWVRPDRQRRGIGTALIQAAERRNGPINLEQQRYTAAGVAAARRLAAQRSGG
jgi:GNAT superfamily N-acetyltransferase